MSTRFVPCKHHSCIPAFLCAFTNFIEHDTEVVHYGNDANDWDGGDDRVEKQVLSWAIARPFRKFEEVLETEDWASRYVGQILARSVSPMHRESAH